MYDDPLWNSASEPRVDGIRPSVDNRRPHKPELRPSQKHLYVTDEYAEVRETYRRILGVEKRGGFVDHSEPKSVKIKRKLDGRKKQGGRKLTRKEKYDLEQHKKRILNMQRRISSSGSAQERRKNKYDVRVNPVYIRRAKVDAIDVNGRRWDAGPQTFAISPNAPKCFQKSRTSMDLRSDLESYMGRPSDYHRSLSPGRRTVRVPHVAMAPQPHSGILYVERADGDYREQQEREGRRKRSSQASTGGYRKSTPETHSRRRPTTPATTRTQRGSRSSISRRPTTPATTKTQRGSRSSISRRPMTAGGSSRARKAPGGGGGAAPLTPSQYYRQRHSRPSTAHSSHARPVPPASGRPGHYGDTDGRLGETEMGPHGWGGETPNRRGGGVESGRRTKGPRTGTNKAPRTVANTQQHEKASRHPELSGRKGVFSMTPVPKKNKNLWGTPSGSPACGRVLFPGEGGSAAASLAEKHKEQTDALRTVLVGEVISKRLFRDQDLILHISEAPNRPEAKGVPTVLIRQVQDALAKDLNVRGAIPEATPPRKKNLPSSSSLSHFTSTTSTTVPVLRRSPSSSYSDRTRSASGSRSPSVGSRSPSRSPSGSESESEDGNKESYRSFGSGSGTDFEEL